MKLALVTGASSGIGSALARLIASKGIGLILAGRDAKRLEEIARETGAEWVAADLRKDRTALLDLVRKRAPDLVVNNAGFTQYGPALAHSTASQLDILEVNGAAVLEISLEAARTLQSLGKPGVILNVSSVAGELPFPTMAVYAAAKAFVTSFSQSFDAEMREAGIRVLVSLPGQIATPFAERASQGRFKQRRSFFTLSPEYAALHMWKQIEKGDGVAIIDWRYRLSLWLSRMVPRRCLKRILSGSINKRY